MADKCGEIYDLVNQLMDLFDVSPTSQTSLSFQLAQQMVDSTQIPYNMPGRKEAVDVSLEKLSLVGNRPNLIEQYKDLKASNVYETDSLVQLASRIYNDKNMRNFLKLHDYIKKKMADKAQKKAAAAAAAATGAAPGASATTSKHQVPTQLISQMPSTPNQQQPITSHQHQYHQQHQHHHHQQQQQQYHHDHLQHVRNAPHDLAPINGGAGGVKPPKPFKPLNITPMSSPSANGPKTPVTNHRTHDPLSNVTPNHNNPTNNLSPITITPASRKSKNKERTWKYDMLHQKMKDFLMESSFLSFDFKKMDNWNHGPPIPPLGSLSIKEQESVLIEDLLYVLIGTEGRYIRMQPSPTNPHKHTIGVERGGDELVYTSATGIIKICPLYSTIVHFAEDVNFGLVNQALAGNVRELIKDYLIEVSVIQTAARRNEMTLSTMKLQLLPFYYIMKALKEVVDKISQSSFYGGHTLSILHTWFGQYGDQKFGKFCLDLITTASKPYFEILHGWIYMGVIDDPFGEFFICDNESKKSDELMNDMNSHHRSAHGHISDDQSWEKRFTCDYSKVPEFLRSLESMILGAGKYICVVRRYGKNSFRPLNYHLESPLSYTQASGKYSDLVHGAYKFASKELIQLLMDEKDLIGRLYSIKRYFLMESGDFFVQFTDMAEEELSKAMVDIDHIRVESLLELAIRTSGCERDPYKDDLRVQFTTESLFAQMSHINNITAEISAKMGSSSAATAGLATGGSNITMSSYNQHQPIKSTWTTKPLDEAPLSDYCLSSSSQLMGWEGLVLAYDIRWPLSIIISEKCQTCYQLIFRHIFSCKYVELQLQGTWKVMQQNWRSHKVPKGFQMAFALRQKMLNFVQNLLYYMMIELIEPNFTTFINKIKMILNDDSDIVDGKPRDRLNEMIKLHSDFVTGILQDSMLTTTKMLQHVTKLLVLCMEYSVITNSMCQKIKQQQQADDSIIANRTNKDTTATTTTPDDRMADRNSIQFQETILEMNSKFDAELKAMINSNPTASTITWLKLTSRPSKQNPAANWGPPTERSTK